MTDKELEFLTKVAEICKDATRDKSIEFECPICKGEATASISGHNGHKWAKCTGCGATLME